MAVVQKTQAEIDDLKNRCSDLIDAGENPFFGLTYAEGVQAALDWIQYTNVPDPLAP